MINNKVLRPLSEEGRLDLLDKLQMLNKQKDEMIETIKNARDAETDLLENSEYLVNQDELNKIMESISKIDNILSCSYIVDKNSITTDSVQLYNKVKLYNKNLKKEQTYILVSEAEANPKQGKITTNSPLGAALLNKKIGDNINYNAPIGTIELEILEITL